MQGCDGSILLDNANGIESEKDAVTNGNLGDGFDTIDDIKTALENVCLGVVSCADIVAVASQISITLVRKTGKTQHIYRISKMKPFFLALNL